MLDALLRNLQQQMARLQARMYTLERVADEQELRIRHLERRVTEVEQQLRERVRIDYPN